MVFQEIYSLADRIGLRVPDIDTFVDNLNSVGYLLKKGPKIYQVQIATFCKLFKTQIQYCIHAIRELKHG